MSVIKSPIKWFGGKTTLVNKLLPLVPEHKTYVEVFGGGASLMCAKEPSLVEVYNDLDSRLTNLFRVLRDPEQFTEFSRLVSLTLYSRQNWQEAVSAASDADPVKRAWGFYVQCRQSFSGELKSWSYVVSKSCSGMAEKCSAWLSAIERLPEIHQRWQRVQIEQKDWRKLLITFDSPETFFYLDPPYVASTRKSGGYSYELLDADHQELVDACLGLQGKVLLSGYPSPIYQPLLNAGWSYREWPCTCSAAGRIAKSGLKGQGNVTAKQPRTEAVWANYELPGATSEQFRPLAIAV